MRKGFTLIELMAVIVIISLVCLLTFPNIVNQIQKSKDANKDNTEKVVLSSAKKYVNDNIDQYSNNDDYCISVEELVDNDYLKEDIVNNEDNNLLDWYVKVSYGNDFEYKITKECLPYTTLDYIESTGTQYIDTGYIFNGSNYDIELKASLTKLNNQWSILCGERHNVGGSPIRNGGIGFNYDVNYINYAENGLANVILGKTELDKVYVWNVYYDNINKYVLASRNDEEPIRDDFSSSLLDGKTFFIFGFHTNGLESAASAKIYYFKIKQDNILVRDFIPVLDSDGVACLYDKVEDKYYYNQGTGEFLYE